MTAYAHVNPDGGVDGVRPYSEFRPVTGRWEDEAPENKAFWKATPSEEEKLPQGFQGHTGASGNELRGGRSNRTTTTSGAAARARSCGFGWSLRDLIRGG